MSSILSTQNLSKKYGNLQVLDGISLEVTKGAVFGLLGPNGSGKTTTLGILLDIIPQNSGSFRWFDQEPTNALRKRIGSILETPNFHGYLTAEKNLKIACEIKEVPYSDIDRVLDIVDLKSRKKDKFKTFSLGMKQRLAIGSALLGNPEVLLLDEPTNGLDPQGIAEIRNIIKEIAGLGVTIILASHMLDEVEKVCTHVAIIKKGKLMVQGAVGDILVQDPMVELSSDNLDQLKHVLKSFAVVKATKQIGSILEVKLHEEIESSKINKFLVDHGIYVTHLVKKKKNLEKQFLEITNN
jgi:ABC-2 type transport system ATP-binding protein